jgi:protein-S-isoprenylcysteine O-methyltransferase Ste14
MRVPVPWVFILVYLGAVAVQQFLLAYVNFLVIPVEEKNLRGVFGDEYQKYSERVGRWL